MKKNQHKLLKAAVSTTMLVGSLSMTTSAFATTGTTATPNTVTANITTPTKLLANSVTVVPVQNQNQAGAAGSYTINWSYGTTYPTSGEIIQISLPGFDLSSAQVGTVTYTTTTNKTGTLTGSKIAAQTGNSVANVTLGAIPTGTTIKALSITLTGVVSPTTAGNIYKASVADPVASTASTSGNFAVAAGAVDHYVLGTVASTAQDGAVNVTAGQPLNLSVSAVDPYGNVANTTGTFTISTDDGTSPSGQNPDLPKAVTLNGATPASASVTLYNATTAGQPASLSLLDSNGQGVATLGNINVLPNVTGVTLTGIHGLPSNTQVAYTINAADQYGNVLPSAVGEQFNLASANGLVNFYSAQSVDTQISNVTIPDTGIATFYAIASHSGNDTITATAQNNGASQSLAPFDVTIDTPTMSFAGNPSSPVSVPVQQKIAVQVTNNSGMQYVKLSAFSKDMQMPYGTFYSSATSSTAIDGLMLENGQTATVYYSSNEPVQDLELQTTVTDANGNTVQSNPLALTVGAAGPNTVAVTPENPIYGIITAGQSQDFLFELQDQYGNETVSTHDVTFQLNVSKMDPMTQQMNSVDPTTVGLPATVTIPAGQSTVTQTISPTIAGNYTLQASTAGMNAGSYSFYVNHADAAKIGAEMYNDSYQSGRYGVLLSIEDAYGNLVQQDQNGDATSAVVNLQSSVPGATFQGYGDSTQPLITQANVYNGQTMLYYNEPLDTTGPSEVTFSATGLDSAVVDFNAPSGVKVYYTQETPDTWIGTLDLEGPNYAPYHPLTKDLSIALSAPSGFSFTDANGKVLPSSSQKITLPHGQDSVQFTVVTSSSNPTSLQPFSVTATPDSTSGFAADTETVTPSWHSAYTVTRQLQPGWNTLSVPFGLANPTLSSIFSDHAASVEVAYAYQNGKWLQVITNGKTDLTKGVISEADALSHPLSALYVKIGGTNMGDQAVTATLIPATTPDAPATYSLSKGWNFVGPSFFSPNGLGTITDFLVGVDPDAVPLLVDPNNQTSFTNPLQGANVDSITNGLGYWLYSTGTGTTLLGQVPSGEVNPVSNPAPWLPFAAPIK